MRDFTAPFRLLFRIAVVFTVLQFALCGIAMAKPRLVKEIVIKDTPFGLEFEVSGKAPVKVIQISKRELLVAMKNVSLAKNFRVKGKDHPAVASVSVETLDGNVVAVVVTAKKPYPKVDSGFNAAHTRFRVSLAGGKLGPGGAASAPGDAAKPASPSAAPAPAKPEKAPKAAVRPESKPAEAERPAPKIASAGKQVEKKKQPVSRERTAPVYIPPKRSKSDYQGDVSDICRGQDAISCDAKPVQNALRLIKKELYKEAYEVLDQYTLKENFSCLEQVHFLRAYVYYKSVGQADFTSLINAERLFQDALVSYPKSDYVPFAYAAMGMIQMALKNRSAAEGYFNIVDQGYKNYTGMPEVHYHLARIYDEKGYTDKALRLYKSVFQSPLDNSYITDAGVGYGKALFDKRKYYDALGIFNFVIKNDVKKVYESPDLLMRTADANFELGLSHGARENYTRVLNLFPDIPNKDLILSKVGDAFGMENKEAKAIKIYELVREKFPDTPGYINASIGLARYMKTDPEKIEVYEMIKNRFPENTYARIAMMRLAEIYQKNGEYNKCIKEIEDLLSTHPRGLRYEAVKLMQRAYEALFKQQLKADEYTKVLDRYEREHTKIDKFSSRLIDFQVGTAYLKANLYEQAFNHLITAYKQYKRSERTSALLFGLGKAMDESGRDEDALKLYTAFFKRFPKSGYRVSALMRSGRIYLEKDRFDKAGDALKKAYAVAGSPMDKGDILMLHADVYEKRKDFKAAARYREKAVRAYGAAPGQHYTILADAYKTLGNTYLDLDAFVSAADAFSKALSFSEGERAKANIGFLLGDAYQKGNILDKARQAYEQVQAYDSVWARLAQQRLTTLSLADKMINS